VRSGDVVLRGEVASPADPPSGCYFHPRCSFAVERCRTEPPALREVSPQHLVRCHLAEQLSLDGVAADRP
jgi:peptide/nickel transport system ATP-binding protein